MFRRDVSLSAVHLSKSWQPETKLQSRINLHSVLLALRFRFFLIHSGFSRFPLVIIKISFYLHLPVSVSLFFFISVPLFFACPMPDFHCPSSVFFLPVSFSLSFTSQAPSEPTPALLLPINEILRPNWGTSTGSWRPRVTDRDRGKSSTV